MAFGAAAMVGHHVSWVDENGETQTGTIDGVTFGAQGPVFDVDGTEVPLASLLSVTQDATSSPTPPSSDAGGDADADDPASS
jgi:flagellar basal-body rod modification protein FlgD